MDSSASVAEEVGEDMSPSWLPPLDPHNQYTINFAAAQKKLLLKDPSSSITKSSLVVSITCFAIRVHVRVGFYSDSGSGIRFDGLDYLTKVIFIPCHELICDSAEKTKRNLQANLSELGIPFELNHVSFIHKLYGEENYSFSSEKKNWAEKFQDFLRLCLILDSNPSHNIVPLHLTIDKMITIPDSLHEGWICWYDCSKKLHPDFKKNYQAAISRPRNHKELLYEDLLTFDQFMTAMLKEVEVNPFGGLEDACSICLEELSNGKGGLKSLSCAHVFHDHCIKEWLERSQVCPLCRDTLPFRIQWVD